MLLASSREKGGFWLNLDLIRPGANELDLWATAAGEGSLRGTPPTTLDQEGQAQVLFFELKIHTKKGVNSAEQRCIETTRNRLICVQL